MRTGTIPVHTHMYFGQQTCDICLSDLWYLFEISQVRQQRDITSPDNKEISQVRTTKRYHKSDSDISHNKEISQVLTTNTLSHKGLGLVISQRDITSPYNKHFVSQGPRTCDISVRYHKSLQQTLCLTSPIYLTTKRYHKSVRYHKSEADITMPAVRLYDNVWYGVATVVKWRFFLLLLVKK